VIENMLCYVIVCGVENVFKQAIVFILFVMFVYVGDTSIEGVFSYI
jgi:hypothetical protein